MPKVHATNTNAVQMNQYECTAPETHGITIATQVANLIKTAQIPYHYVKLGISRFSNVLPSVLLYFFNNTFEWREKKVKI